jgi:hypothetical protein
MIPGTAAFDQIVESLGADLTSAGFTLLEARENFPSFGSRSATFSDGTRFVRLSWDATEAWFVLEGDSEPQYRPSSGEPVWLDLTLQRFDPAQADAKWLAEVTADLSQALGSFLGTSAA